MGREEGKERLRPDTVLANLQKALHSTCIIIFHSSQMNKLRKSKFFYFVFKLVILTNTYTEKPSGNPNGYLVGLINIVI